MSRTLFRIAALSAAMVALTLTGCDSAAPGADTFGPSISNAGPGGPLNGAIYTSLPPVDGVCSAVNANTQYTDKAQVYLNGGPRNDNAAGLTDGTYWVQVTTPSGVVLGRSPEANVTVTGGRFDVCYQLIDRVQLVDANGDANGTWGFDDTTNPGGVYKVWISQTSAFTPSGSRTDNFRLAGSTPPPPPFTLTVSKFYDANADGLNNDGQPILDWLVSVNGSYHLTPYTTLLGDGDAYTVSEVMPIETNWVATTPTTVTGTATAGGTRLVEFGNVCIGGGGGHTIGFWRNRNGMALISGTIATRMAGYTLRNANGSAYTPATSTWERWLQQANATNMAYMLSAQMAAMILNVALQPVENSHIVYAPALIGSAANETALGFITIGDLISAANASLVANGNTTAAGPARDYQAALKDALDAGNNNLNFVQGTPCAFTYPAP